MNIARINPQDLGRNSHGWISPEGTIYSGCDEHAAIAAHILDQVGDHVGIGWIRYLTYSQGKKTIIAFDWTAGFYTEDSERLARAIAKRVSYPYDMVTCDYGDYKSWHGSLDEFIRHGVKGRKLTNFESRLETLLRVI
jgi:hypothetical protein